MSTSRFQELKNQIADLNDEIEVLKESIVKDFSLNKNIPHIAHYRNVEHSEVIDVLIERQAFEDIGLIEWMEQNVNSKSLFRGIEFFQHYHTPTVETCMQVLGMDESTAKLSQVYHAHHYKQKVKQV